MPVIVVASTRPHLRQELGAALAADEFTTIPCSTGLEAVRTVFEARAVAVIVDLQIPDMDGMQLISILRAASELVIIAVTDQGNVETCVQALEAGADDVTRTTTPTSELMARIRAALRRRTRSPLVTGTDAGVVRTGALLIDNKTHSVTKDGRPIPLTRTEYRLLAALAAHAGQVVPHRVLLTSVWGHAYINDIQYLRLYIRYLRAKLEDDPSRPRYLLNERGLGYRLGLLPSGDDGNGFVGAGTATLRKVGGRGDNDH